LISRLYGTIDHIYGPKAIESNNGFTNAQAFLNVIETMLNVEYLYLAHSSPSTSITASPSGKRRKGHPTAPLIGFTAAVMTLSKTLLYHLQGGWDCMALTLLGKD
jgi:uroporphyrin-III C-methyltransferase